MPAYFYTVFARRFEPAIHCAVLQCKPIPTFIHADDWEFAGTVRPSDRPPEGFRHAKAEDAMRFVGYYVFHSEPAQRP
ncbi:hypothetical protein [Methylobacterium pseudosasicola]|uniref:Uncharacterized protein n=1 Tax=Methylobacterium pseudosasicola TaxID=582667 RepID=A0A1I4H6P1_9HYPH|nr:hypothetical protein [Methylobacterium pseudosasicola]SFL37061.1 hypothetical protein SAMN05192568_100425 [Methylobacterium pseudosasicola]